MIVEEEPTRLRNAAEDAVKKWKNWEGNRAPSAGLETYEEWVEKKKRMRESAEKAEKDISRPGLGTAAAHALGEIGPLAKKEAANALRKLLGNTPTGKLAARFEMQVEMGDERFKGALARALGKIDPTNKKTVEQLTGLLKQAVEKRRSAEAALIGAELGSALAEALERAGPAADPAVDALGKLAETNFLRAKPYKNRAPKLAALKALKAIGTKDAREKLAELAEDADDEVVQKTARKFRDALEKAAPAGKKD
jgi:hypothetical protein